MLLSLLFRNADSARWLSASFTVADTAPFTVGNRSSIVSIAPSQIANVGVALSKIICLVLVGWLDGWVAWWAVGWMGGWLDGWLVGCVVGWLVGWVVGWVLEWVAGWLAGWLGGWWLAVVCWVRGW